MGIITKVGIIRIFTRLELTTVPVVLLSEVVWKKRGEYDLERYIHLHFSISTDTTTALNSTYKVVLKLPCSPAYKRVKQLQTHLVHIVVRRSEDRVAITVVTAYDMDVVSNYRELSARLSVIKLSSEAASEAGWTDGWGGAARAASANAENNRGKPVARAGHLLYCMI